MDHPTQTVELPELPELTSERVEKLADVLQRHGVSEQSISVIRSINPGLRITLCSEDDITVGHPVSERNSFFVYLVGGSHHCLTLTDDYQSAIGIVLAEKESAT